MLASTAAAQSTRPAAPPVAPTPWQQAVTHFAQALRDADTDALATLLDKPVVRQFKSAHGVDPAAFAADLARLRIISAHGYFDSQFTVASDLADDFKKAKGLPDTMRRNMLLGDDAQARRANATAQQWIEEALGVNAGDAALIGVIVLWQPTLDAGATPVFVLLKGRQTPDGFKIAAVVYGDPTADN
jgi:hypothetical protein